MPFIEALNGDGAGIDPPAVWTRRQTCGVFLGSRVLYDGRRTAMGNTQRVEEVQNTEKYI